MKEIEILIEVASTNKMSVNIYQTLKIKMTTTAFESRLNSDEVVFTLYLTLNVNYINK